MRSLRPWMPALRVSAYGLALSLFTACATTPCDLDQAYSPKSDQCEGDLCPPGAPQEGPGSRKAAHAAVETSAQSDGFFDSYRYSVYLPANPSPKTAPVILFLHGYFDATPEPYDAMLRHFAQKGYIVVYPSYGNALNPKAWADNAEESFRRALVYLKEKSPVAPDLNRVAYVGHSIGGILALHLAEREAKLEKAPIPLPRLITVMDGAGIVSPAYPSIPIDDLSHIPKDTHLLVLMAEETYLKRLEDPSRCAETSGEKIKDVCNGVAVNVRAFQKTTKIPDTNKISFLIRSDMRGKIGLRSEHNGAQGYCGYKAKPIDAIDTWGYWRYTTAALDETLKSDKASFTLIRTREFRNVGKWSDGRESKIALSLDACFKADNCPTP